MLAFIQRHPWRCLLFVLWLVIIAMQTQPLTLIEAFGSYTFLGVVGAVFANATGAGGGVVFVPFFHHLGFSPAQIVATSFAIQCCGMTAGAVTWLQYYRSHHRTNVLWQPLPAALWLTIPGSVGGILLAQWASHIPLLAAVAGNTDTLHIGFGVFSIILALAIFASVPLLKRTRFKEKLATLDVLALPLIAFAGGIVTAWLSVGVGELVAVYLIIRGLNITMAIAAAVMLSAVSVWFASIYHVTTSLAVFYPVVLFAGAGAVLGGILARHVVLAFQPAQLKIFFGLWVMLLGISSLPLF